jgi:hypothetical protein
MHKSVGKITNISFSSKYHFAFARYPSTHSPEVFFFALNNLSIFPPIPRATNA